MIFLSLTLVPYSNNKLRPVSYHLLLLNRGVDSLHILFTIGYQNSTETKLIPTSA
jgi:hypothetical protein